MFVVQGALFPVLCWSGRRFWRAMLQWIDFTTSSQPVFCCLPFFVFETVLTFELNDYKKPSKCWISIFVNKSEKFLDLFYKQLIKLLSSKALSLSLWSSASSSGVKLFWTLKKSSTNSTILFLILSAMIKAL